MTVMIVDHLMFRRHDIFLLAKCIVIAMETDTDAEVRAFPSDL